MADGEKEKVEGKAKEMAGKVTGNEDLEAEGKGKQVEGKARDMVGDVKDKIKDATN